MNRDAIENEARSVGAQRFAAPTTPRVAPPDEAAQVAAARRSEAIAAGLGHLLPPEDDYR